MGYAAKKEGVRSLVLLDGDRLRISFSFHPRKVAFIKRIRGARYEPSTKTWTVPASSIDTLRNSHEFSIESTDYEDAPINKEHREHVLKNPFEVPIDVLLSSGADIIVKFDSTKSYPVISAPGISKARRFLQSQEGLTYTKSERGFLAPADRVSTILRSAKGKGYLFGVEEDLGKRLKETAELRGKILLSGNFEYSLEEYAEALLFPQLDYKEGTFFIADSHAETLKVLFPEIRSHILRKAKAESLSSQDELASVAANALRGGIRIWVTRQAKRAIETKLDGCLKDGFEDGLAVFLKDQVSFIHLGKPILFAPESFTKALTPLKLKEAGKEVASSLPSGLVGYIVPFSGADNILSRVASILGSKSLDPPPKSRGFISWFKSIGLQGEARERSLKFQTMEDADPPLENAELKSKLFPHQRVAVSWILEQEAGFLGDDMGLGKTLSVLASFEELKRKGEVDFLLVVSPMSLVRNWLRESAAWTPSLRLSNLPEGKGNRDKCLRDLDRFGSSHLDGLVINYETLRLESVLPIVLKIVSARRTFLCVDESHRVKNPQSQSFQALKGISSHATRRLLLSGTPIPRDIADIWGQMLLIDKGERLGTKYYDWLSKVAELGTRWSDYAIKKYRKDGIAETISRVQEVLLRRAKEDVINLPPKLFSVRDVSLSGDQLDRYEAVRKDLLVRVSTCTGDVFQREIGNILEEYLRAVQIASNPRLVDETWKGEPAKFLELDTIVSDVAEERGEKLIIWSSFRKNIDELCERYRKFRPVKIYGGMGGDERSKAVSEFQSVRKESARIFIGNPAAAGVGLTLTAAKTAVYLDKTWNAGDYLQSIDRVHRIGQRGTVTIISLHSTLVDELIARNLAKKERVQRSLLEGNVSHGASSPTRDELIEAVR